jgi:hypothetical protein
MLEVTRMTGAVVGVSISITLAIDRMTRSRLQKRPAEPVEQPRRVPAPSSFWAQYCIR